MARLITQVWPAASVDEYAALQDVLAGASVKLKGTNRGLLPGIDYGARTVSITSANDLSAVNFTIRGFLFNIPVEEIIAGPNNNTVYTTGANSQFTSITAITVDADANEFSVGTGTSGVLNPMTLNPHVSSFGVSIDVIVDNNIEYSLLQSLEKVNLITPEGNRLNQESVTESSFPIPGALVPSTARQYAEIFGPVQTILCLINENTTDGDLKIHILQQGIA
jgi:hypothetical protein